MPHQTRRTAVETTDAGVAPPQDSMPTLSVEELSEIIALAKEADSVELKLSVPDASRRSTVSALGMDPLDAQIRQVTFFDTPDLALNRHGVVVRARRVQHKAGDVVVKLRPLTPSQLPADVRRSPQFGVEIDAMPGGYVCSGTMKARVDDAMVKDLLAKRTSLSRLLDKQQRRFFAAHAPEGVGLDDLSMLGPVVVFKLKFTPPEFGRGLVAELWFYPDGSRILELSTKCDPAEAFQVAAESKAFLAGRGVDLSAEQQTKTKTALEFFAAELSTPAPETSAGA